MGCTQSKIENEEAVARCKERKHFMKEAVTARNAFAAAHTSYATYLKNTGAALSDFIHGELQNPPPPSSSSTAQTSLPHTNTPPIPPFDIPLPPPPPNFPPSPLQRAMTMPEMKMSKPESGSSPVGVGPIVEEEEEESGGSDLRRRGRRSDVKEEVVVDRRPPVPPQKSVKVEDSNHRQHVHMMADHHQHQPPVNSAWEYFFFPSMENVPGTTLRVEEEEQEEGVHKEEDHEKMKMKMEFDVKAEDVGEGMGCEKDGVAESEVVTEAKEEVVVETPEEVTARGVDLVGEMLKKGRQGQGLMEGKRAVKASINLVQIFAELDDDFLKASESAHEVSKMLEATRLHYHSNFADNRGHIDHSARVMRVITWNRSFKGMPNLLDDGKDDFDYDENETHATILDKLLAWEKKLYDEVKAGELMKFEYQRKVASLNKLKKRGTNTEALEKAKASVSHLHTRYIVDMQSLDSTVSEINNLRDEQLYPRLVTLVDGMATMWKTMHDHHEKQSNIVMLLRALDSHSPTETTEHHHDRTYQLLAVVKGWCSQFEKLVTNQKGYMKALNNWLKQNLIPIESNLKEKVSSPPRIRNPPIQGLILAWQDHLEKLPDELARTAISNFAGMVESIFDLQRDEMDLKRKCEESRKELSRKTRQFEDWYHKYLQRKIPDEPDADRPESANATDEVVVEKQFLVEQVKKRLEEEEDAYARQCVQVRQKSLASLKTRLPELFRAMSDFALGQFLS